MTVYSRAAMRSSVWGLCRACRRNRTIGTTPDIYSHVMPGMQSDAAVKIDAGMRAALAGGRGDSLHRMHR